MGRLGQYDSIIDTAGMHSPIGHASARCSLWVDILIGFMLICSRNRALFNGFFLKEEWINDLPLPRAS